MRFLLDNDVDAAVRTVLTSSGHDCWTAHEAGLAGDNAADDDDVAIYAQVRDACVITHDREFSLRRIKNTSGRHVWLRCEQPDAANMVLRHPAAILDALSNRTDVVIEVHADRRGPSTWARLGVGATRCGGG